jgi:uncharacterized protein (DUF2147 family)
MLLCLSSSISYAEEAPLGYWETKNEITDKPEAIIQIKKIASQALIGQIIRIYSKSATSNRVGIILFQQLKQSKEDPHLWIGGTLLDNGKMYHCTVQIIENGQKLRIRSYMGLPLFGQSKIWSKISNL